MGGVNGRSKMGRKQGAQPTFWVLLSQRKLLENQWKGGACDEMDDGDDALRNSGPTLLVFGVELLGLSR